MDKHTFAALAWENRETLYRIAKSVLKQDADCEDAVSQAIVNGMASLSKLKRDEYAKTWLVRIVLNECYHILNARKRMQPYERVEQEQREKWHQGQEKSMESVSSFVEYSELYQALMELPVEMRTALVLFYVEEWDIREIARAQKVMTGTVKSRLSRGRKKLRELLEKEGVSYER